MIQLAVLELKKTGLCIFWSCFEKVQGKRWRVSVIQGSEMFLGLHSRNLLLDISCFKIILQKWVNCEF